MIQSTTFIQIGHRLINPAQITSVDLEYSEEEAETARSVEISLADGGSMSFWGEEAQILRQFFLSGSRTYNLESFYGERAKSAKDAQ